MIQSLHFMENGELWGKWNASSFLYIIKYIEIAFAVDQAD